MQNLEIERPDPLFLILKLYRLLKLLKIEHG